MPTVALAGLALFFLLAFGVRTAIHFRRTGTTGFVALRAAGSRERMGGALFTVALLAAAAAPVLHLLGVALPVTALDQPVLRVVGLVLFAAGLVGTLVAQYGMGDSWRIGVDASERTALVTTGIYSRIRNPIYTAMTIALVGIALLTPTWVAGLALVLLIVALEVQVRLVEEPHLLHAHGRTYAEYGARTGRFVRGLGRLAPRPAVDFVPAAGLHALTPLYDFFAWLTGDRIIKRRLLATSGIVAGHDVLDLGCGTGTLAIMTAEHVPGARVVGLDVDPAILAIARKKIARSGARVALTEGSATAPPFSPASFDRVLSTLVLHHLTTAQKRAALQAVRALLRPGGELHVADFGRPHNRLMRAVASIVHHVDGGDAVSGNLHGELPTLMRDVGLVDVAETENWMTPFGTLTFMRGASPRA